MDMQENQDKQEQVEQVAAEETKAENVEIHVTGWTLFSDFKL